MRFLYIAQCIFSLTNNSNMGKNHHKKQNKKKPARLRWAYRKNSDKWLNDKLIDKWVDTRSLEVLIYHSGLTAGMKANVKCHLKSQKLDPSYSLMCDNKGAMLYFHEFSQVSVYFKGYSRQHLGQYSAIFRRTISQVPFPQLKWMML